MASSVNWSPTIRSQETLCRDGLRLEVIRTMLHQVRIGGYCYGWIAAYRKSIATPLATAIAVTEAVNCDHTSILHCLIEIDNDDDDDYSVLLKLMMMIMIIVYD